MRTAGLYLLCTSGGLGNRSPRFIGTNNITSPVPQRFALALELKLWGLAMSSRGVGLGCVVATYVLLVALDTYGSFLSRVPSGHARISAGRGVAGLLIATCPRDG